MRGILLFTLLLSLFVSFAVAAFSTAQYKDVMRKSMQFYRANRSGRIGNEVGWRNPACLKDGQDIGRDLSKGYFDAGDYMKYSLPGAWAMTTLAWGYIEFKSSYEAAGMADDLRDAIRWGMDYYYNTYQDGKFVYQVGDVYTDHSKAWERPDKMYDQDGFYRPSKFCGSSCADIAGETAAALAAASIVFKHEDPTYSAQLLAKAKSLYTYAESRPGTAPSDGSYNVSHWKDELAWAAIWLYQATGSQTYLSRADQLFSQGALDSYEFSWASKGFGVMTILSDTPASSVKASAKLRTEQYISRWRSLEKTRGGLSWYADWAPCRYAANGSLVALIFAKRASLSASSSAVTWARSQIDYILGDNPRGSSFIVGWGNNPPKRPHHKAASCPSSGSCGWSYLSTSNANPNVLVGAMVGGPHKDDSYADKREAYEQSEVGVSYNAGITGALGGLVHFFGGSSPPPPPPPPPPPGGCADMNTNCPNWANRGYCDTNSWVKKNCQKSCNLCGGNYSVSFNSGSGLWWIGINISPTTGINSVQADCGHGKLTATKVGWSNNTWELTNLDRQCSIARQVKVYVNNNLVYNGSY